MDTDTFEATGTPAVSESMQLDGDLLSLRSHRYSTTSLATVGNEAQTRYRDF